MSNKIGLREEDYRRQFGNVYNYSQAVFRSSASAAQTGEWFCSDTNMIRLTQLIVLFVLLLTRSTLADEVVPTQQWSGRDGVDSKRSLAPNDGIVVGQVQFAKIWNAWRPGEAVPVVNFNRDIILATTVGGPNKIRATNLRLSEAGELTYQAISTRMGGPGFGYLIMQVPRAGITKVNTFPVPASQPANSESVEVSIVGRVKTGLVAIGGETTGTVISANNITWELDLQGDEQLIEAVQLAGKKAVRVKGTLIKKAGVEVRERWIVQVQTIKKNDAASQANAFSRIQLIKSGGFAGVHIETTVDGKGAVETKDVRQRVTENTKLDSQKLASLHQIVAETDWPAIQADSRSPGVRDAFQYSFTIVTSDGKSFDFISDDFSINKQSSLRKIVETIGR